MGDISARGLNAEGVSYLMLRAVRADDLETATLLLERGASFEKCGDAVREAAKMGLTHMVHTMAEAGCNLEEPDPKGFQAIHLAACQGHSEIVAELCRDGCSVNSCMQTTDV